MGMSLAFGNGAGWGRAVGRSRCRVSMCCRRGKTLDDAAHRRGELVNVLVQPQKCSCVSQHYSSLIFPEDWKSSSARAPAKFKAQLSMHRRSTRQ